MREAGQGKTFELLTSRINPSIIWSGLDLQVYIPALLGKISRFTVFNIPPKSCHPRISFLEKNQSHALRGGRHYVTIGALF